MATSLTHKYIPRIEQTEENLFIEEYYSSTDTKIYIDDIEQTEISYINYSLQEQLKPIYGYASRTFDDVAIGNRIVIGTLKVPIKNPEAQTSMNTIVERSINSTLEDYNESQQELMDTVEWITAYKDTTANEAIIEDDETFEYRTKLISLGYNLDYNSNSEVLKTQIKRFQSEHGLDSEGGNLTDATKSEIDKALNNSNIPTINLPTGTNIYTNATFSSGIILTLIESQDVYILDNISYDDGWTYIMTKNGETGFVNIKEEEV